MKKLDKKVNVIPIIAKADTILKNELQTFKDQVSCCFLNTYSVKQSRQKGIKILTEKFIYFKV